MKIYNVIYTSFNTSVKIYRSIDYKTYIKIMFFFSDEVKRETCLPLYMEAYREYYNY